MNVSPENSPLELYRLIANMIRRGRVEDVRVGSQTNPASCTVRLSEDLVTDYLPWFALAAGGSGQTRHWRTPARGEPCLLLATEGDLAQAVALPGIYSSDMPQGATSEEVERHDFSSTDYWEHNRTAGTLRFDIAAAIELKVGASVLLITPDGTTLTTPSYTVDSPDTEFTGTVTIQQLLTFNGGIAGKNGTGAGAGNAIQGGMNFTGGSITHDGKNIGAPHTHSGVQVGSGSTGGVN